MIEETSVYMSKKEILKKVIHIYKMYVYHFYLLNNNCIKNYKLEIYVIIQKVIRRVYIAMS